MTKSMPKILHKEIVAESNLFKIESVGLKFSNGNTRVFERFLGTRNSVMVIPLLDKETLLLVKEYAVGTERYEITFPKGIIDQNENLHDAANRELKEEIGFGANSLHLMKEITSASGYASGKMYMLLAQDLYQEKLIGDEPEDIEIVKCKVSEADEFILREDFTESRSIAAMLLICRILAGIDYKLKKLI